MMVETLKEAKIGVLIISDRAAKGERPDRCFEVIEKKINEWSGKISEHRLVADDRTAIQKELLELSDECRLSLVLTSGGTGLAPRDVTPEATLEILERPIPGITEYLRHRSFEITPLAALSRGVCGIRGSSLILNLPGSPVAVKEYLDFLEPILPHALKILNGRVEDCRTDDTSRPLLNSEDLKGGEKNG